MQAPLRQILTGLFNVLLGICMVVVCKVALCLLMDGDDTVTPVILSFVSVCSASPMTSFPET